MAVVSGPSVPLDPAPSVLSRSAWSISLPLLLFFAVAVSLNGPGGLPLLADPDTQWHVTVGNWILDNGRFPIADVYSYTFPGQPWIAKEWASQVLLAAAYNLGGWGAVTTLAAMAIGATFALLLRLLLRDLRPFPALLFTLAALIMSAPHFLARPHVLAFPLILLWVSGLVRAVEARTAPPAWLLAVMLLWANMHGGFTLGILLAGAFALDALVGARDAAERRTLFISWAKFGIGTVLVACITPYGPESILVTSRIFGMGEALSYISEWQAPNFQKQGLQELMVLIALYLVLSRGLKVPLVRLLILLGLVHLFLRYARNAELLATLAPLALAPVLARQFPAMAAGAQPDGWLARLARPAGPVALAIGVGLPLALGGLLISRGSVAPPTDNTPAAAVAWARDNGLKGRVFNHYGFGGYLISQGVPTFIDGRGELFGGDFVAQYAKAVNLSAEEPFEALLDRHDVSWTLLLPRQPANHLLARLPNWRRAYADDAAVIYVRER